jgi:flavorubredoxin
MSSTEIPKDNSSYDDINYWNQRYESEDTYDWLLDYSSISHIIKNHVSKDHSILMLGKIYTTFETQFKSSEQVY